MVEIKSCGPFMCHPQSSASPSPSSHGFDSLGIDHSTNIFKKKANQMQMGRNKTPSKCQENIFYFRQVWHARTKSKRFKKGPKVLSKGSGKKSSGGSNLEQHPTDWIARAARVPLDYSQHGSNQYSKGYNLLWLTTLVRHYLLYLSTIFEARATSILFSALVGCIKMI